MYEIYTTMFGICIPDELNRKLQEAEITELFDGFRRREFQANIPYSGADEADIHLGVALQSTESRSKVLVTEPTKSQLKDFEEGLEQFKEHFKVACEETEEEFSDLYSDEENALIKQFVEALDGEPVVYRAYSTS
jgi:hypothetical protein